VVSTPCMTLLKLPHGAYRYACQSKHLKPELELRISQTIAENGVHVALKLSPAGCRARLGTPGVVNL